MRTDTRVYERFLHVLEDYRQGNQDIRRVYDEVSGFAAQWGTDAASLSCTTKCSRTQHPLHWASHTPMAPFVRAGIKVGALGILTCRGHVLAVRCEQGLLSVDLGLCPAVPGTGMIPC